MCVEVLSIVTQACAVERINKDHGCVHNRARASMANHTTRKALYIFTNESLLQKPKGVDRPNPLRLTSFELFLSNTMPPIDAQDIISKLVQAPVSSFLSQQAKVAHVRRPARARTQRIWTRMPPRTLPSRTRIRRLLP